jgi:hypothetical protein
MSVFSEGLGRYIARDDVSLKTSGAEAASTTQAGVELGDKAVMDLEVVVSAASGSSPTMLITIEGSNDGSNWYALGEIGSDGFAVGALAAPANITTTGTYRAALPAARYVRTKSTIGGSSPSFTYSVGGSAA